jgi:hypothetical protein
MEVLLLGKHIGLASGWDPIDDGSVQFYDFAPNEEGKQLFPEIPRLNASCAFDAIKGVFEVFDPDSELLISYQLTDMVFKGSPGI